MLDEEMEMRDRRVSELRTREGIDKMTDEELRANLVTCDFRGEEVKAVVLDELLGRVREAGYEKGRDR